MAQQTTPEILSIQRELENFIESLGSNLRFHILTLLIKYLENDSSLREDDIEKEGQSWLTNILLVMLTKIVFGLTIQQRVELMNNLQ